MPLKAKIAVLAVALLPATVAFSNPSYYPADYNEIVNAAVKEGRVNVYGTFKSTEAEPFIVGFKKLYPKIEVDYVTLNSVVLYNRLLSESAAGDTADLAISPGIDTFMKLANDGLALTYTSPEKSKVHAAGVWKDQLYNLENEPVCNIYNKNLLEGMKLPESRKEFVEFLSSNPVKLQGKVITYDIERSAVAYAINYVDSTKVADFWSIPHALGAVGVQLSPSAFVMSERIASGEIALGYNIPCQVLVRPAPTIGNFFFKDNTNMTAQAAFVPKASQHPNAGKLFLDFMLSKDGQQIFANMPGVLPVRPDVSGTGASVFDGSGVRLTPAELGLHLLDTLDPAKRTAFLSNWKAALERRGPK